MRRDRFRCRTWRAWLLPSLAVLACSSPAADDTRNIDTRRIPAKAIAAHVNATRHEPLLMPAQYACRAVRTDESAGAEAYPVPTPPFSEGMFPCTRCHDKPDDYNPKPRSLLAIHLDIKLAHGPREQWCYDCHNPTNRDMLRLAGGRLVSFERSYELCGQCHGEKLRDWRRGIHGRRTGCWNGERQYLLCVNCHSPHGPQFKPMHPEPRPKRPDEIRRAR